MESIGTTAMEAVGKLIGRQVVDLAVELKGGSADAVGISAYDGSPVVAILDVVADGIVSQTDITELAIAVGHHNGDNAPAKVSDADFHARLVGEDIEGGAIATH